MMGLDKKFNKLSGSGSLTPLTHSSFLFGVMITLRSGMVALGAINRTRNGAAAIRAKPFFSLP